MSAVRNPQSIKERELASKVNALKQISIDIGQHVNESNLLLDDMGQNMGNISGMLSNARVRMRNLMKHGGMRLYCYLTLFIIFVIWMLVLIVKWGKN